MFFIYVLKSITHKRYYTGCIANIDNRLMLHNLGKVKSTKSYKPWKVIYTDPFNTKPEAYKREQQLKSYKSGEAFKKLIENTESWQSG